MRVLNFQENHLFVAYYLSINTQKPLEKKLTNGEQKAFEIRNCIIGELENRIDINSLSKHARISDKSLQSSFKSIFGFPPKRFIHLLRLNLAHRDLTQKNSKETTVSNISLQWGFRHFGRFAKEYKEVFGVKPSETLLSSRNLDNHIDISCTNNQNSLIV